MNAQVMNSSPLRLSLRRNHNKTSTPPRPLRRHTLSCNDVENTHPNVHWKTSPAKAKKNFFNNAQWQKFQVIRHGCLQRMEETTLHAQTQAYSEDQNAMIEEGATEINVNRGFISEHNDELSSMVPAISPVRKSSSFFHRDSITSTITCENWIESVIQEETDSLVAWSQVAPSCDYDKSSYSSLCDDTFNLSSDSQDCNFYPAKVLLPEPRNAGATNTNEMYSKCTAFPRSARFVDFRQQYLNHNNVSSPEKCGCQKASEKATAKDSWWSAQYLPVSFNKPVLINLFFHTQRFIRTLLLKHLDTSMCCSEQWWLQ
jgi:hypothetical protein